MTIYHIHPVTDNPLFEGLALSQADAALWTCPRDWKEHPLSWEAQRLRPTWQIREVEGNVRLFNDYPCINLTFPAFSQRAFDLLRDVLESNGELLPVRHILGVYFFFNCTHLVNSVDVSRSGKTASGMVDIGNLAFIEDKLPDLEIFKDRSLPSIQLCTQRFVDRVQSAGLQGFIFIPVWPLSPNMTYHSERYRLCKLSEKWKPNALTNLDVKGNTVVLRLCCQRKKATKEEIAAVNTVMAHLETSLYDAHQAQSDAYFGNVEGSDIVDFEVRVFISTPDSERLLAHLKPSLQSLPWPGQFYVVKRRGNFMESQAIEEYVSVK